MTVPVWRRARSCEQGQCVEVTEAGAHVFIRDSKNKRMVLRVDAADWDAFLGGVKDGDFDSPGVTG